MGGGWSPFEVIGAIFSAVATVVATVATMGVLTGVLAGVATMMLASTIEGIATGRMFSSLGAFLFEPLRLVCKLLGITDKNVTQGFMTACKIFHENQYPDTLVKACINRERDGTDLSKYFYDFSTVGTAQFDKYYYTGKRRYVDALPDASIASATFPLSIVEEAIKEDKGYNIKVEHATIGYPDDFTWVKYYLQEQGNYDYEMDTMTFNSRTYRLKTVDFIPANNTIIASFIGINGNNDTYSTTIPAADTASYFIATYHKLNETKSYMWIHRTVLSDLGIDFTDDDWSKMIKGNINGLPIACLRNNKIDVKDAADNSNASPSFRHPKRYKQTNKLLKSIGLTVEKLTEEYHKNNDINNVYDAYVIAGICPKQTIDDADRDSEGNEFSQEVVAKYIYKAIEGIYTNLPCAVAGQPYFFTYEEPPLKGQVIWAGIPIDEVIGSKCSYKHYAMDILGSDAITYKVILQVLTEYLGTEIVYPYSYDPDYGYTYETPYRAYYYKAEYFYVNINELPITPAKIYEALDTRIPFFPNRVAANETYYGLAEDDSDVFMTENQPEFPETVELREELGNDFPYYFILKTYEVTRYSQETEDYYTETLYTYENLGTKSLNSELSATEYATPYSEPASLGLYYQHSKAAYTRIILRNLVSIYVTDTVGQGLLDSARITSEKFIFPISYSALKSLTVYDKTKLISEGFYLLFFAKQTTHLAFYETPEFGTFLQIIGVAITIVVTIFSWGTQTVTTQMVIQSLIQMIAVYVGVTLALQIIAMFVPDSTLKAILSAAVMVIAIWAGGGFSDFNFSTAVQLAEIPIKAIDIYTNDQMKYLQQDYKDLTARYQSAQQAVDTAAGKMSIGLDTFDVLETQALSRSDFPRLISIEDRHRLSVEILDLYTVCQDQIDRNKDLDLDKMYPLYNM